VPAVNGFLPSTTGFAFSNNDWPDVPYKRLRLGPLDVPVGHASNGVCGGMVFAARDYFESDRRPPTSDKPPQDPDDPLFVYLVTRLFDSYDGVGGVSRYVRLSWPTPVPDRTEITADSITHVKADIDGGKPAPLGLIKTSSWNPFDLRHNHQTLAYGYDLDGAKTILRIYDPNHPGDDTITYTFDGKAITTGPMDLGPIRCLLHPTYSTKSPPA